MSLEGVRGGWVWETQKLFSSFWLARFQRFFSQRKYLRCDYTKPSNNTIILFWGRLLFSITHIVKVFLSGFFCRGGVFCWFCGVLFVWVYVKYIIKNTKGIIFIVIEIQTYYRNYKIKTTQNTTCSAATERFPINDRLD